MRIRWVFLTLILCVFLYGQEARLSPRFQTVYILEMANSFDQHLASRLTAGRVLWVVLDPKSADAVITESLDENFVSWMQRTYPPAAGTTANDAAAALTQRAPAIHERSRGTVFLVDPRKRIVLWSACELRKDTSSAESDRAAIRLSNGLKAAFGKK
jgi:hypothetical protein